MSSTLGVVKREEGTRCQPSVKGKTIFVYFQQKKAFSTHLM